MNGIELLTEFRGTRSEQAFAALVRRYTNLVYSVAQRRVSSVPLAQEVTQSVFIRLATSVPNLSSDAQLAAWLHRTTVHVSIDLWRAESRRRTREEHVAAMQTETVEEPAWAQLAPALDDALNKLEEAERQVLLLRFFEQRSMRELGGCLGISEDAAKMRVSRATDKLRTRLKATGLACTATGLTTLMAEHSVAAAPAAVITALSQLQVPVAPTLFQAMAHAVAHGLKSKAALGSIAALVVAGLFVSSAHPWNRGTDAASNATAGAGLQSPEGRGNKDQASQGVGTNLPDPRKLLQMASSARERILSGEMKLITTYYGFERPLDGTNTQQIQVLFDRGNLRFDTVGHEYRYTSMERDAREVTDAKRKAQGLTREAAEQAGLLQGFDSHQVTIFDGNRRLEYRETSDGQKSATIDSSDHGGSAYLFDPRVIGLTSTPQAGQSPEDCLGWRTAKSVELVGKEELLGVPCWHVRVSDGFNVWIDAENPICIRKYSWSEDTVISQFDENTPKDPLPRFVRKVSTRNGAPRYETSIRLLDVKINTAVDAASFTLAGLGMKPGTDVADVRIHRRIGSWNGSGLTPDHSEEKGKDTNVVSRSETMRTLEMEPASAAGHEAAVSTISAVRRLLEQLCRIRSMPLARPSRFVLLKWFARITSAACCTSGPSGVFNRTQPPTTPQHSPKSSQPQALRCCA